MNVVQIKHGDGTPPVNGLQNRELGISDTTGLLFIGREYIDKNGEKTVQPQVIGGPNPVFYELKKNEQDEQNNDLVTPPVLPQDPYFEVSDDASDDPEFGGGG